MIGTGGGGRGSVLRYGGHRVKKHLEITLAVIGHWLRVSLAAYIPVLCERTRTIS